MPALGSARWAASGAALAATALLIAGCGGSAASPQPKPDPGGASAPPSQSAGPELHYPQQLDASPMIKDPCSALTGPQIHKVIGAKPNEGTVQHAVGVTCVWHPASIDEPRRSIGVHWPSGDVGMDYLYRVKDRWQYFQPTSSVAGFPAVVTSQGNSRTAGGECVINVGVNEQQLFFAEFLAGATPPPDLKPCAKARQAAKYVIQKLKGGS
jgi:hypothetical protein